MNAWISARHMCDEELIQQSDLKLLRTCSRNSVIFSNLFALNFHIAPRIRLLFGRRTESTENQHLLARRPPFHIIHCFYYVFCCLRRLCLWAELPGRRRQMRICRNLRAHSAAFYRNYYWHAAGLGKAILKTVREIRIWLTPRKRLIHAAAITFRHS